jgi:hypothetical protein
MHGDFDEADLDAFRRAMAKTMEESDRAEQIAEMLEDRPWVEVAQFAAFHCQIAALKLQQWDEPPCHCPPGNTRGGRLLNRMLERNISQYEPDPMAALAKAPRRIAKSKRK